MKNFYLRILSFFKITRKVSSFLSCISFGFSRTVLLKMICFSFILFFSTCIYAQKKYSTSNQQAIKLLQQAGIDFSNKKSENALKLLDKAIGIDPNFIEAYLMKGDIYADRSDHIKTIEQYKKAIEIDPEFFKNTYYSLANEELFIGNYSDAMIHIEKFLSYPSKKGMMYWRANLIKSSCEFALKAVSNPVPYDPKNMGDSINTENGEYFPTITADGMTFLFTRRLPTTTRYGASSFQEDFYISKKSGNDWGMAKAITEINTGGNEGAPALSADGQYIFFTSCAELDESLGARKTHGSCDLFLSKKVGDKFSEPRNLEFPICTDKWESQPSFSSDGRTLYFVRKTIGLGGVSQHDIMVSHIGDDYSWSEPVSVSDLINTPYDELSVFIHPDDQTLYFSSSGHPGMGGNDIFLSRRDSSGKWMKPENLGYPINTVNDENSFLVSPDGKTAFFASDRDGGKGGLDLYQFSLYEKVRPKPVTYMKGKVFDAETKKPLSASFELIDLASGKVIVSSSSNVGNGEFIVALPAGKKYALNVSKDGYLFYSDNFRLDNPKSADEPVLKDVAMKPIKAGESIVLNNIFYDTDKYDLKDESKVELGKLITFLTKNPKINFEISGHTDNVGTKPYNQTLSEKRAKSVYDYLLAKGIPVSRMISKGYGDSKPVADNNSETGRAKNRRTEFMITSLEK